MEQAAHLQPEELTPALGFGQRSAVETAGPAGNILRPGALEPREHRGGPVPPE